jgi:hypothetical protein
MGILALSADERVRDVRFSEDTLTVRFDGRSEYFCAFGLVSETVWWDCETALELEGMRSRLRHSLARP